MMIDDVMQRIDRDHPIYKARHEFGMVIDAQSVQEFAVANSIPAVMDMLYIVKPPARVTWVEFPAGEGQKVGAVISELNASDCAKMTPPWATRASSTLVARFLVETSDRAIHVTDYSGMAFLDETGGIIKAPDGSIGVVAGTGPELPDDVRDAMSEIMLILCLTLTMLNVKNMEAVLHTPSEKLQRKRKKKGQFPLFRYYTLNVTVPGIKRLAGEHKEGETGSMPLHSVRGHLADYREGKGLFGRLHGVFWIPAHARGNIDNGIVVKRHKLKVKREEGY